MTQGYYLGGFTAEIARPCVEQHATLLDQACSNVSGCDFAMNFVTERELGEVGIGAMFVFNPSSERRAKSMKAEGPLIIVGINPIWMASTEAVKKTVEDRFRKWTEHKARCARAIERIDRNVVERNDEGALVMPLL